MIAPTSDTSEPEYRIYGSDTVYAVVDYEDYIHFIRWRWKLKKSKRSKKTYLTRCSSRWSNGVRTHTATFYLHIEIQKRKGDPPPTPEHIIVDHEDSDEHNCRRYNLRWATVKMNNANRKRRIKLKSASDVQGRRRDRLPGGAESLRAIPPSHAVHGGEIPF